MKTKVTEKGLLIPKQWLEGVNEVEVRKENEIILVMPVMGNDPIYHLGDNPLTVDINDASITHDRHIYGEP